MRAPVAPPSGAWSFAVDRGGTFTDIVGLAPDGELHTLKLLSLSPAYEDAGIEGVRRLLGMAEGEPLDPALVSQLRIGTTVATNALLERKVADTAFVTTAGFEQLLEIGDGTRPHLFRLAIEKPAPLAAASAGVRECISGTGEIVEPLDVEDARRQLLRLLRNGHRNLAITLRHAWKNPCHEQQLAELARELGGFTGIVCSHEVIAQIGLLKRGRTTLVEGCLSPVLFAYAATIRRLAGNIPVEFMQSSGGLCPPASLKASNTILSGPAGGVAGYSAIATRLGHQRAIGFDMGGTSTDVSRFEGRCDHLFECSVDGITFHADMLDVETVAAGGGSILSFDGQRLRVGPESAGSDPGPACYGLDGPLTITDANLLLGRILPEFMPRTFGPERNRPLDCAATQRKFTELAALVTKQSGTAYTPESLAAGFLRIANETMGRAMKKISVSRGYDSRTHCLVAFGGAAAQHACDIASLLDMHSVLVPRYASVLSAYGIALASRMERASEAVMETLSTPLLHQLAPVAAATAARLARELQSSAQNTGITLFLDLRPAGTDTWLSVEAGSGWGEAVFESEAAIRSRFTESYRARFGFEAATMQLEVVNIRTEARIPASNRAARPRASRSTGKAQAAFRRRAWVREGFRELEVYDYATLLEGDRLQGPALIADGQLTLFLQEGFSAMIDREGNIGISPEGGSSLRPREEERDEGAPDPMLLELFNKLFMNIAEQMGQTLENTAHSVNMKERRDFSCALFDREGRLVSNAPHIPVHLGAMEASVQHVIERETRTMQPGDAYLANNPHAGGSHLPDITLVTPLFTAEGAHPAFYVANRGHHADIGGTTPGSMPPSSKSIHDEGVVIDSFLLIRGGRFREEEAVALLASGPYPARNLPERLSDLKAQVAANNRGIAEIERMLEHWSLATVERYMEHIRANARSAIEQLLGKLAGPEGSWRTSFSDAMDNGTPITAAITITAPEGEPPRAQIDFSGTGPQDPGNLNAPPAVTRAAVLYVLRSLVDDEIPLNAGCLEPVELIIPEGSLLNPSPEAAVALGNVETSQRVVDVLLGAFGAAAASQGTMNNLLFGRPDGSGSQYYETIPGGSGATPESDGASGVQVHMTNTRITDPEILEHRFPEVRLTRFSLREGSGGNGNHSGGNGTIRELLFQEPMHLSLIAERRTSAPFGLEGGEPGAAGMNSMFDAEGNESVLEGRIERVMHSGETLRIMTPGGGGWGNGDVGTFRTLRP